MLTALALGLVAARDTLEVPTTLAAVERSLASVGYPLKPIPKADQTYEIVRGRTRVWMGIARMVGDPAKRKPDTYPFFELRIELAVAPGMTFDKVAAMSRAQPGGEAPTFAYHLGDTVTESETFRFGGGTTRAGLKASLDRFFRTGRAMAALLKGVYVAAPKVDGARLRFADSTELNLADQTSLRRVAASWGWGGEKDLGYTSQGWLFPIRLGGKRLFLRQTVVGTAAAPRSIDVACYDDLPVLGDPWAGRLPDAPMPSLIYDKGGMHLPLATQTIDLQKGVALGDLRRRIEGFAREN